MNLNGLAFFIGYVALFFATLCGVILWDRRQRRTRLPLPENVKLLRMPGEYLWRRVLQADETDMLWFFGVSLIPISIGAGALLITARFFPSFLAAGLVVAAMLFAFSLLLCVRWFQRRWQRRADDYLGFFGERYVAEWLDPLKTQGWFIFHDIQCDGASGKFNLDHVAVGPGGVWLIETKTHRKGRARSGFKDHEVIFDGSRVAWPWRDESDSIRQASDNMRWLKEWLRKMTGKDLDVAAVLTFPGYWVTEKRLGAVRAVNPKVLPQVLCSRGKNVLRGEDVDLIRRQLEEKCRDVEY